MAIWWRICSLPGWRICSLPKKKRGKKEGFLTLNPDTKNATWHQSWVPDATSLTYVQRRVPNERNFSGHKYGRTKFSWGTSTDDLRDDERTKFSLDTSTDDLRDTMGTNEIFAGHKYGRFIGRKTDTIVGHNDRRLRGTYRQTTSWKWMMVSSMPELLKMVWRATSTVALLSVPN